MNDTADIDWDEVFKTRKKDADLVKELGVSVTVVRKERIARGLPTYSQWFWDQQPLGKVPDPQLARQLKVSKQAVQTQRRRRGIPPATATTEEESP